jgi:hypothetical protein
VLAPKPLDGDAAGGARAGAGGDAEPADQEARRVEAVVLAIIFAGAAAEVISLWVLLR